VRHGTIERFGPVRSVAPAMVFELDSKASGARGTWRYRGCFPRMLRWRSDNTLHEADTLAVLEGLLEPGQRSTPMLSDKQPISVYLKTFGRAATTAAQVPEVAAPGPRQAATMGARQRAVAGKLRAALLTAKRFSIRRRADETHHRCCCHAAFAAGAWAFHCPADMKRSTTRWPRTPS
jgi:hypothetical protein